MSDSSERPASRGIGRVPFIIFLGLFLLAALFWLALDAVSKKGLARYEQQEHFNFADFIPKPVPDESNFALVPVVASSYAAELDENGHLTHSQSGKIFNRLEMNIYDDNSQLKTPTNGNWQLGQPTDLKPFQQYYRAAPPPGDADAFPVADEVQSPAADVLFALSKYDETIEELRQAAALPDSRFPLNYDSDPPAEILLPHLSGLKRSSQVLELRAVAELKDGQTDQALADVKLMLRLIGSTRNEPFLISQLVRLANVKLALQPIWEGTQEHRWSDGQLKELEKALTGFDFLTDYEYSMRGDCALEIANIEYLRRTRNVSMLSGDLFDDHSGIPAASGIELRVAPDFVYYHNEMLLARAVQDWVLPIADVERHSVSFKAAQLALTNLNDMQHNLTLNNALAAMMLQAYPKCAEKFSYAQSSVSMARVAVALERYRLAHTKYPDSLNALAPACIQSVPADIIGGKPLIYHPTKDGRFVLYSIGWNGTDDGGKVLFKGTSKAIDYEEGDWVWAGQVIGP